MSPSRAVKTLKALGYTVTETSARGTQVLRLGTHAIHVPADKDIAELYIDKARVNAFTLCLAEIQALPEVNPAARPPKKVTLFQRLRAAALRKVKALLESK